LLDFAKSFGYFRTPAYQNLSGFIRNTDYELHIIGHSCGLSNRTLLSQIFESKRCYSIQLHYYNNEKEYINNAQEISRHFKNKIGMRSKLRPYTQSTACPQINAKETHLITKT
jgi:hypothetical protein